MVGRVQTRLQCGRSAPERQHDVAALHGCGRNDVQVGLDPVLVGEVDITALVQPIAACPEVDDTALAKSRAADDRWPCCRADEPEIGGCGKLPVVVVHDELVLRHKPDVEAQAIESRRSPGHQAGRWSLQRPEESGGQRQPLSKRAAHQRDGAADHGPSGLGFERDVRVRLCPQTLDRERGPLVTIVMRPPSSVNQ